MSALAHSGFCLPLPALLTMLPPPGSLEPDEDPLCMLLLIDHLALRARSYEYLIHLFEEWEVGMRTGQAGWASRETLGQTLVLLPLCLATCLQVSASAEEAWGRGWP